MGPTVNLENSDRVSIYEGQQALSWGPEGMTIMHTLYDSDAFVVVHMQAELPQDEGRPDVPQLVRQGFEIVDKRSGKEIYLDGSLAEMFQRQILAWQVNTPSQEEVEDTLEGFSLMAHTPVLLH